MSFKRQIENFTCEHCGVYTEGDGYTNHCPHCLWSKHVDVNPGDRVAACGGLMEPMSVEGKTDAYILVHKCQRCGEIRKNRTGRNDNADALIFVAGKAV